MLKRVLRGLSVVFGMLVTGIAALMMGGGLCTSVLMGLSASARSSISDQAREVLMLCAAAIIGALVMSGLGIYLCQWGLRQRRRDLEARANADGIGGEGGEDV